MNKKSYVIRMNPENKKTMLWVSGLLSLSLLQACGSKPVSDKAEVPTSTPQTELSAAPGPGLQTETKILNSGYHYTIIYKDSAKVDFTLQRPDPKDGSIQLVIAGAFTDMNSGKVDGACAVDGKVIQNKINPRLGGAVLLDGKNVDIIPLKARTDTLDAAILKRLELCKCSFFQQIQLIVNGKAEHFIDTKLFQRRALVNLKSGKVAVIESKEAITLATFAADLVELGAVDALYTDMGDWDEGWYRSADGKMNSIGESKLQTAKQSNWIYFKR